MSIPARHPWFTTSSSKRKHPSSPSESSNRAKRRRSLEHGFANMTLEHVENHVEKPPRPATPPVPEIIMKPSTWYEPERDRIVITDLENYSDDEADDVHADAPLISPALLKAITTRPLIAPPQPDSQALVLFRPLSSQIPPRKPENDDAMDVEP